MVLWMVLRMDSWLRYLLQPQRMQRLMRLCRTNAIVSKHRICPAQYIINIRC